MIVANYVPKFKMILIENPDMTANKEAKKARGITTRAPSAALPKKRSRKGAETEIQRLARQKKEERDLIQRQIANQREQTRRERELKRLPAFKTKVVDYSDKRRIRIDAKTWIYIRHDQDEETERQRFLNTYSKSFKSDGEKPKEQVTGTKVCTKCKEEKNLGDFLRDARGKFGRRSACIECGS